MTSFYATYDPANDKLRLRASSRLDAETYSKVKATGFAWAPKQDLFYAIWCPAREDLLVELAGEVDDEETSLDDRAAQRAERFSMYQGKRAADADQARKPVASVADGIPLGHPILVGHHSERHARRDAERIENGMRRAVKLWETSAYWQQRAASAISHARYLEQPAVHARRIGKLEAEKRSHERDLVASEKFAAKWANLEAPDSLKRKDGAPTTLAERVGFLARASYGCKLDLAEHLAEGEITPETALASVVAGHDKVVEHERRWIGHIDNRLAYEPAMLAADGGTAADKNKPEKGGACKCWVGRGTWLYVQKVNKISVTVLDNWGNGGENFTRTVPFDKLTAVMSRAHVEAAREAGRIVETPDKCGFVLLTEKPKSTTEPSSPISFLQAMEEVGKEDDEALAKLADFDAIKQTLKAGVQIAVAPTLFPTPPPLAKRMASLADLGWHDRVLEPSAGTGNLVHAIVDAEPTAKIYAVEINRALCDALPSNLLADGEAFCSDFLACTVEQLGHFNKILMNPPYHNGADFAHVKHAMHFLERDGVLVALCANGPRQEAELRPLSDIWEPLPDGTFAEQGTKVRVVLLTVRR